MFKPKEPVQLDERTEVEVLIAVMGTDADGSDPTEGQAIDRLIGLADDEGGPTDVSERHDDYLYGGKRRR